MKLPAFAALTKAAMDRAFANTGRTGQPAIRLADIVTEKTIVNGIVGLLATGGSTNHTLHIRRIMGQEQFRVACPWRFK